MLTAFKAGRLYKSKHLGPYVSLRDILMLADGKNSGRVIRSNLASHPAGHHSSNWSVHSFEECSFEECSFLANVEGLV